MDLFTECIFCSIDDQYSTMCSGHTCHSVAVQSWYQCSHLLKLDGKHRKYQAFIFFDEMNLKPTICEPPEITFTSIYHKHQPSDFFHLSAHSCCIMSRCQTGTRHDRNQEYINFVNLAEFIQTTAQCECNAPIINQAK